MRRDATSVRPANSSFSGCPLREAEPMQMLHLEAAPTGPAAKPGMIVGRPSGG